MNTMMVLVVLEVLVQICLLDSMVSAQMSHIIYRTLVLVEVVEVMVLKVEYM